MVDSAGSETIHRKFYTFTLFASIPNLKRQPFGAGDQTRTGTEQAP